MGDEGGEGSRFTYLLVHEGLEKGEEKHDGAGLGMDAKQESICMPSGEDESV